MWNQDSRQQFRFFLFISSLVHALFFLGAVLRPSPNLDNERLLRSALRVDVVGLPDKLTPANEPAPKMAAPAKRPTPTKPAPVKPAPEQPSLADLRKRQQEALKATQARSAIEALKEQMTANESAPTPPAYRGNKVIKGDSLVGTERVEFEEYHSQIRQHLRQFWDLPRWLADADLKAQAVVSIDEKGFVVHKELLQASGNPTFDEKVLAAISASSPFPAPPERLRRHLASGGVVFVFPE